MAEAFQGRYACSSGAHQRMNPIRRELSSEGGESFAATRLTPSGASRLAGVEEGRDWQHRKGKLQRTVTRGVTLRDTAFLRYSIMPNFTDALREIRTPDPRIRSPINLISNLIQVCPRVSCNPLIPCVFS
jgi:hypothetical protein